MTPTVTAGQHVPSVTFRRRQGAAWKDLSSDDYFAGRKVVLFSLPGAYTPTCSSSHVPRYNELFDRFKAVGVDAVACLSVNDGFVMEAWQQDQGADKLDFLPDGNGEFTEKMGLLVDKSDLGFGKRSWRYSMLVEDGIVTKLFIEPEIPGDPFQNSDADTMLQYLGGTALPDVVMVSKPTCGHCVRAKDMLREAGIPWAELPAEPRILAALPGSGTTPQIFVDGQHIGGADQLAEWLSLRQSASAA